LDYLLLLLGLLLLVDVEQGELAVLAVDKVELLLQLQDRFALVVKA
jgi:hypothetical protein